MKELSHVIEGKNVVTIHEAPSGQKAYTQWGVA
jgi:hypothetical protein